MVEFFVNAWILLIRANPCLQVATDTGGLMDNKSIFKHIGELESNLCQGSLPDPQSYPRTRLAGGVIGFV